VTSSTEIVPANRPSLPVSEITPVRRKGGALINSGRLDHVQLHLVNDIETAFEFKRWLSERRQVLAVDTETTGLRPYRDKIRLIQFGDLDSGWAIPWERWSGVAIEALSQYEEDLTLHNSKFDASFIINGTTRKELTWPWHRMHDTMTMAHLLNPLRPKGLKPLAAMLVDSKAAAMQRQLDEAMKRNKWTWHTVPLDFPAYWVYGALDPVLTSHIHSQFVDEIETTYKRVYDIEMAYIRIAQGMESRGLRIDRSYCMSKRQDLLNWATKARNYMRDEFHIANPGSTKQLLDAIQKLDIPLLPKKTAGGAQALDKEVLELIDHPIGEYTLGIRKAEKIITGYLDNFLEMADENDLLHCNIHTMGTRTARSSITEPALQTLQRNDPTVRCGIIPLQGNSLITIDADQIEMRLMAHFSKDENLIAAFFSDDDFFVNLARQIFQDSSIVKSDPRRDTTKNVAYGKAYCAGAETMARTARVPLSQMLPVVEGFDKRFPGVQIWQAEMINYANKLERQGEMPYTITPFGRRMISDPGKAYTLVNYAIQCHAAEILKRNICNIDALGFGEFLRLPIHDEVLLDVPQDQAKDVLRSLELIMNDPTGYRVPITWSGEILNDSWGEKYLKKALQNVS
jgi:DNA polymerase-1